MSTKSHLRRRRRRKCCVKKRNKNEALEKNQVLGVLYIQLYRVPYGEFATRIVQLVVGLLVQSKVHLNQMTVND